MLDNDPELLAYRERIERRYHQRREGLRREGTGRRTEDRRAFAAAFPPPVLLMFAGLIAAGLLMFAFL